MNQIQRCKISDVIFWVEYKVKRTRQWGHENIKVKLIKGMKSRGKEKQWRCCQTVIWSVVYLTVHYVQGIVLEAGDVTIGKM